MILSYTLLGPLVAGVAHSFAFAPAKRVDDHGPYRLAARTAPAHPDNNRGWSPKPTGAPKPRFAEMELLKRYDIGTDTCGFIDGWKSSAYTCAGLDQVCTNIDSYLGCCDNTDSSCSTLMISTCLPYSSSATSCGPNSLCCGSDQPECWTWLFSSSTATDKTFTAFNCWSVDTTATLLDAPPILTLTTAQQTSTETQGTTGGGQTAPGAASTASATATGSTGADPDADLKSSSTNVGAIVGGVVGGLAVLGAAAVAIFWLLTRNKRKKAAEADTAAQQQMPMMGQGPHSPGMSTVQGGYYAPSSFDQHASFAGSPDPTKPQGLYDPYGNPMQYQNASPSGLAPAYMPQQGPSEVHAQSAALSPTGRAELS